MAQNRWRCGDRCRQHPPAADRKQAASTAQGLSVSADGVVRRILRGGILRGDLGIFRGYTGVLAKPEMAAFYLQSVAFWPQAALEFPWPNT
jgi:hypothetical protein